MSKEERLVAINNHRPIIVNYGKGYYTNDDIKDYAVWDYEVQAYRDSTGIWSTELLKEIAEGKSQNAKIELGE